MLHDRLPRNSVSCNISMCSHAHGSVSCWDSVDLGRLGWVSSMHLLYFCHQQGYLPRVSLMVIKNYRKAVKPDGQAHSSLSWVIPVSILSAKSNHKALPSDQKHRLWICFNSTSTSYMGALRQKSHTSLCFCVLFSKMG